MPAMNRSRIEVFVVTPYSTIGIDGGMMMPSVADTAVMAAAKPFG